MRKKDKLRKKQAKTAIRKYAKRCRRSRQRATATKSWKNRWNLFLAKLALSAIAYEKTVILKQIARKYKGKNK